jgi:hypothetical protein
MTAVRKAAIGRRDKPMRGVSQWNSVYGFTMLSFEADRHIDITVAALSYFSHTPTGRR